MRPRGKQEPSVCKRRRREREIEEGKERVTELVELTISLGSFAI